MTTVTFDTLKLVDQFKEAGFSEAKARSLAETFGTLANEHMVTKEYLDGRLRELQYKLVISLGSITVVVVGLFTALGNFFN